MALTKELIGEVLSAMTSHAKSLGLFGAVGLGIPAAAPAALSLAVFCGAITPDLSSGLDSVSVRMEVDEVIYSPLTVRQESAEAQAAGAASVLLASYCGAFTLGGLVRNVDVMRIKCSSAYVDFDGAKSRAFDLTIPLVVNDAWTEAA